LSNAARQAIGGLCAVVACEVFGSEVMVRDVVAQDVIGGSEHRRSDSNDSLLGAAASAQT
jgi:hypothetical protein